MNLLELRKKLKRKKPKFIRQEGYKLARLEKVWRTPRGHDSKLRRKHSGKRKQPSIGYSSPKEVRHLHPSGLKPIVVKTISDLKNIKSNEGVIVAKHLGIKKKIELIKKIQELKLHLLDLNAEEYILKIQERLQKKKEAKKEKHAKKEKTKKELAKETKKAKETKEETTEEKEKREKEEKRKVLEKRQ